MPFKPKKIISNGQSGAALGALVAAQKAGLATGGWAPLGFKTERGPQPDALIALKVEEHPSHEDGPAARKNVIDSQATVIFTITPKSNSSFIAVKSCEFESRPYILINPNSSMAKVDLESFLERHQPDILNVTGNRDSSSPGIAKQIRNLLFEYLSEQ